VEAGIMGSRQPANGTNTAQAGAESRLDSRLPPEYYLATLPPLT
jgi:hypothetical protein